MSELNGTTKLQPINVGTETAASILEHVYRALQDKGYDPIAQLTGFILTGDPTYITSHNAARSLICRLERDEILEELVRYYVQNHFGG
ncbi:MAG: IreB family regulatory phosphoprotein [Christensenellales bacterium]